MDVTNLKFEVSQNPHFFIEKFAKLSEINKWSNDQKCMQLCLALPKEAESWYLTLNTEVKEDFDKLKDAFVTRFDSVESRSTT